jgi:diaminopimelate epimerase
MEKNKRKVQMCKKKCKNTQKSANARENMQKHTKKVEKTEKIHTIRVYAVWVGLPHVKNRKIQTE